MSEVLGRVEAAKGFAECYGFSKSRGAQDIELTDLGNRLVRYDANASIDFLIHNARLQDAQPFAFLRKELQNSGSLTEKRIAGLLRLKFGAQRALDYAKSYGDWMVKLRLAKWKKDTLEYVGGKIRSLDIIAVDEACQLMDSSLYDWITETFLSPQEILSAPSSLLSKVATEQDDNRRGEIFEEFVGSVFRRLGFSPRLRDGYRETKMNLTYQRPGGGDVAAFCHFPLLAGGTVHPGFAIACEAKSTETVVGSTAVGQVRNLAKKIGEAFANYVVQSVVVSRSKLGYDSSGKEQAPPEVVHLTSDLLNQLLTLQVTRFSKSLSLVTPISVMLTLDDLVKSQILEPDWGTFSTVLAKHL